MVGGPANTNATAMTYTGHMSLSRGWLWLGIFGCSSPEQAECRPGTEPGSSGHCVPSSDAVSATPQQRDTGGGEESADFQVELPPPSWTQADVEGTIDRLFRDDHPRVAPVLELWRSMFIGRDHSCPGEGYNIQVPMSGCITSEGWRYTGPATYDVISSPFEEAIILNADTHIIDDEGTVMIFAGTAASSWVDGVGVGHWRVDLRGMIDYPTSETVWIEGGTSMMIFGGGDVGGQAELTGGAPAVPDSPSASSAMRSAKVSVERSGFRIQRDPDTPSRSPAQTVRAGPGKTEVPWARPASTPTRSAGGWTTWGPCEDALATPQHRLQFRR